jgi:hypothetical protein
MPSGSHSSVIRDNHYCSGLSDYPKPSIRHSSGIPVVSAHLTLYAYDYLSTLFYQETFDCHNTALYDSLSKNAVESIVTTVRKSFDQGLRSTAEPQPNVRVLQQKCDSNAIAASGLPPYK